MPLYWIYAIYTAILAATLIVLVPRDAIRRYAWLAILAGGVGDTLAILFFGYVDIASYLQYGPFGFLGVPFFPPVAWTVWYIMYFHFMPKGRISSYIYTAVACVYSAFFANILVNLGILHFSHRIFAPIVIYPPWLFFVTWMFNRWRASHD